MSLTYHLNRLETGYAILKSSPSQHETPPFLLARFTIFQPLPLDDQTLMPKHPASVNVSSCSPELQCIEGTGGEQTQTTT
jgi:hypothetical protein